MEEFIAYPKQIMKTTSPYRVAQLGIIFSAISCQGSITSAVGGNKNTESLQNKWEEVLNRERKIYENPLIKKELKEIKELGKVSNFNSPGSVYKNGETEPQSLLVNSGKDCSPIHKNKGDEVTRVEEDAIEIARDAETEEWDRNLRGSGYLPSDIDTSFVSSQEEEDKRGSLFLTKSQSEAFLTFDCILKVAKNHHGKLYFLPDGTSEMKFWEVRRNPSSLSRRVLEKAKRIWKRYVPVSKPSRSKKCRFPR